MRNALSNLNTASAPEPYFGTAAPLRAQIEEAMSMLSITARLGADHASVGDDAGMIYCARRSHAYMKVIIAGAKDLAALKSGEPRQ